MLSSFRRLNDTSYVEILKVWEVWPQNRTEGEAVVVLGGVRPQITLVLLGVGAVLVGLGKSLLIYSRQSYLFMMFDVNI